MKLWRKTAVVACAFILLINPTFGDDMKSNEFDGFRVPLKDLKLIYVAHQDFIAFSDSDKFDVIVESDNEILSVMFVPLIDSADLRLGGKTNNGREVRYEVSRKTKEIISRSFAR